MLEVAVVVDRAFQPLYWHEPAGATAGSLPDSRALWEVLWTERARIAGVAHLHPGRGLPAPSAEDLGTFAACEAGLGVRWRWWIATADRVRCFRWIGPGRLGYGGGEHEDETLADSEVEAWLAELRRRGHRGREP